MDAPLALAPQHVSGLLSGRSTILRRLALDRLTPAQRVAGLSLAYILLLIVVTSIEDTLFPHGANALGVALLNHPWSPTQMLSFSLLEDPVSILAITAAFLTPFICLRQAEAMAEMIAVHRENIHYRIADFNWRPVHDVTERANRRFGSIGTRLGSLVCLAVAASLVLPLLNLVRTQGLLYNFRPEAITQSQWHEVVLGGWWSNSLGSHPLSALMIDLAGVVLYYFVVKQLALGLVFVNWIKGITAAGFGTFENLAFNSDGYWGMRVIRRLFQWTYASALLHLGLSLLVIALWLPLRPVTVVVALIITVADALFVVYPTMTTLRGVALERRMYVQHLRTKRNGDKEKAIEAVWKRPMLPFRLRASVSAALVYFLLPTAVVILGSRLGK